MTSSVESDERVIVNVGSGPLRVDALPVHFRGWRQVRVDIDPAVLPDILADLTDLSAIPDRSVDAVWASHCLEHLYEHQVPIALAEFARVLKDDGFACVLVPDLQAVAGYVAADRLHEPLYQSAAGPVTPHDILFGFGAAIASGQTSMAHRCGFTPTMLQRSFQGLAFGEIMLRRRAARLELAAVACMQAATSDAHRVDLLDSLAP